jgi:hypothetical protein
MQYRAEAQKVQVTTVVDINSVSGPKVDIVEHLSKMATDRPTDGRCQDNFLLVIWMFLIPVMSRVGGSKVNRFSMVTSIAYI